MRRSRCVIDLPVDRRSRRDSPTLRDLTADAVDAVEETGSSYTRMTTLLVGPNWVINSPEAADLKDGLDGTLVTF